MKYSQLTIVVPDILENMQVTIELISGSNLISFINLILTTMKNVKVNNSNRPSNGDLKHDLGIWFRYSDGYWMPDQILKNVITVKNAGAGRIYGAHPVTR